MTSSCSCSKQTAVIWYRALFICVLMYIAVVESKDHNSSCSCFNLRWRSARAEFVNILVMIINQASQGRRSSVLRCEKFWVELEQWTSAGVVTVSTPWLSTTSTTDSTRWEERGRHSEGKFVLMWINAHFTAYISLKFEIPQKDQTALLRPCML